MFFLYRLKTAIGHRNDKMRRDATDEAAKLRVGMKPMIHTIKKGRTRLIKDQRSLRIMSLGYRFPNVPPSVGEASEP